jgi:hypothetical protein
LLLVLFFWGMPMPRSPWRYEKDARVWKIELIERENPDWQDLSVELG